MPSIRPISSTLTLANRLDHLLARFSWRRGEHKVSPGLYALGSPSPASSVFISANYTLSFDALRRALSGIDAYILVINTLGINVWCAAGKGTFGTEEIIERVETSELDKVVSHRTLILPQLGAPGVAAHEVKKATGFKVEYGPVRAGDLPAYLRQRNAATGMRRVSFNLAERAALIPVELVNHFPIMLAVAAAAYLLGGWVLALAAAVSVLSGVVLFPLLFPLLPTRDFTTKGFILGSLAAFGMALVNTLLAYPGRPAWWLVLSTFGYLLLWPPVTAFIALNFTGASTLTSRSGVRLEMHSYLRVLLALFLAGLLMIIVLNVIRILE